MAEAAVCGGSGNSVRLTLSGQGATMVDEYPNEPTPANTAWGDSGSIAVPAPPPVSAQPPDSTFHGYADPQPVATPMPTVAPQPAPAIPQPMRRAPVNYQPNEPGWWYAADGLWYPPETVPSQPAAQGAPVVSGAGQGAQTVVVQVGASYPGSQGAPFTTTAPKSKAAAGLLAIFLGAFGAHRFYLGYSGVGVTMLLLTVLSLGLLSPITVLWGLIEGIVILTGGMRDRWQRPLV